MLRVVIALEDKGPAPPPQLTTAVPAAATSSAVLNPPHSALPLQPWQGTASGTPSAHLPGIVHGQGHQAVDMYAGALSAQAAAQPQESMPTLTSWYAQPPSQQQALGVSQSLQPPHNALGAGAVPSMPGFSGATAAPQQHWQVLPTRQHQQQLPPVASLPPQVPITAVQSLPEYEAAYQLEVWKKSEWIILMISTLNAQMHS
jgi:hypothetical protein